jgi:hypothetical protein
LTSHQFSLIIGTNQIQPMSNHPFNSKFRKSIYTLTRAANREIDLEYDQPKLFKKVKKFYEEQGIQFYQESEADYELILSLLCEDLQVDVPA